MVIIEQMLLFIFRWILIKMVRRRETVLRAFSLLPLIRRNCCLRSRARSLQPFLANNKRNRLLFRFTHCNRSVSTNERGEKCACHYQVHSSTSSILSSDFCHEITANVSSITAFSLVSSVRIKFRAGKNRRATRPMYT